MSNQILYIENKHLTASASEQIKSGNMEASQITSDDIKDKALTVLFNASDVVAYKTPVKVGHIDAWKTLMIKGPEEVQLMMEAFPMVEIEEMPSYSRLYFRGNERIGYFSSPQEFIKAFEVQLKKEGLLYVQHDDFPMEDSRAGFLNVVTDDGHFKICYE